jgi:hypothetical protein
VGGGVLGVLVVGAEQAEGGSGIDNGLRLAEDWVGLSLLAGSVRDAFTSDTTSVWATFWGVIFFFLRPLKNFKNFPLDFEFSALLGIFTPTIQ